MQLRAACLPVWLFVAYAGVFIIQITFYIKLFLQNSISRFWSGGDPEESARKTNANRPEIGHQMDWPGDGQVSFRICQEAGWSYSLSAASADETLVAGCRMVGI